MRDEEKVAKPTSARADGVVWPRDFLTTPPRPSATPPPAEEGSQPRTGTTNYAEDGNKSMGHIAAPPRTTRSAVLPINRRSRNPCP